MVEDTISCPECFNKTLTKFGKKWVKRDGKRERRQQYICNTCGRVTVNPKEVDKC